MLAAVALIFSVSAVQAGGDEWYAYKVQVDAYPTGAGTVYVTDDAAALPEAEDYVPSQDFELTTTGYSLYGYAKAAEGWQFIGFAKDALDENGDVVRVDEVAATQSDEFSPAYLSLDNGVGSKHYDESMGAEVSDDSLTVAALMPMDPNNYFRALFTHVAVQVSVEQRVMGTASIDKLVNNIGDKVTLTAEPASEFSSFVNWTLDGEVVSTEPTLTVDVKGVATYQANFSDTRTMTLHFPEEGGFVEFYSPYPYLLFSAATAYNTSIYEDTENNLIEKNEQGEQYLDLITSTYATMGKTATVLYGEGDVTLYPSENVESDEPMYPQLFRWSGSEGVTVDAAMQEHDKLYTFDAEKGVFSLITEGQIAAEKLYMVMPDSMLTDGTVPAKIYIDQTMTTGIEMVQGGSRKQADVAVYDLAGRLASAVKREGIYVLDGRKVLYRKQ